MAPATVVFDPFALSLSKGMQWIRRKFVLRQACPEQSRRAQHERIFLNFAFWAVASLLFAAAAAAHELPPGSASLDAELRFDYFTHRPQRGMAVEDSANGISKNFRYDARVSTRPNVDSDYGEILYLTGAARPNERFYADTTVAFLGNYADRFWRPINDPHRMEASDERVRFVKGEAEYKDDDVRLRLFQGKTFEEWRSKGDLFHLLPGQYETERYLNFSGHAVPRAVEGEWKSPVGEFGFIAGPEVVWGTETSAYGRYNLTRRGIHYALIYAFEQVAFASDEDDDERSAIEATLTTDILGRLGFRAGLLYQPFRLNRSFTEAREVSAGQGSFGSKYDLFTDKTRTQDAFGATVQMIYQPQPLLDQVEWGYTYHGPVAGNKHELFTDLNKKVTRSFSAGLHYTYRHPVIGPMPLLYAGSEDNPGALVAGPRGPDDPFWVNWDNREAHLLRLTFVEDPTPSTWLFRWEPHILDPYNINRKEDAPWAFAAQYRVDHYPTSTDRIFYYDESGEVVWGPAYHTGAWPTKDPLHSGVFLVHSKHGPVQNLLVLEGGESLATSNVAYTTRVDKEKSMTTFFKIQDELRWGPNRASLLFSRHDWGPEEFQRRLGETWDRLWRLEYARTFWKYTTAGITYTRAREEDNRFLAPSLGGYDEWGFFLSHRFSVLAKFRPSAPPRPDPLPETKPAAAQGIDVFNIAIKPSQETLYVSAAATDTVRFVLSASDPARVSRWFLEIRRASDNAVVKSVSGYAVPPAYVWDGLDENVALVDPGVYRADFGVLTDGQTIKTETFVRVFKPAEEKIQTTETPEGLRVSLKSNVLFSVGKAELKPAAKAQLDQVAVLLRAYPASRVRVEGHTDSVGTPERNMVLSVKRAQAVVDYMRERGGFGAERFEVLGLGQTKPLASNKTAAGREANRRVEIIILKETTEP